MYPYIRWSEVDKGWRVTRSKPGVVAIIKWMPICKVWQVLVYPLGYGRNKARFLYTNQFRTDTIFEAMCLALTKMPKTIEEFRQTEKYKNWMKEKQNEQTHKRTKGQQIVSGQRVSNA